MYGGDEIGAVVVDLGSHTVKAGYAGEDTPKTVFQSAIGAVQLDAHDTDDGDHRLASPPSSSSSSSSSSSPPPSASNTITSNPTIRNNRSLYIGRTALHPRPHQAMVSPIQHGGTILDWDAVELLLSHAFSSQLNSPLSSHPCLIVEPTLVSSAQRERLLSLLFESPLLNVPAVFFCKAAVLSAFASGRSTALVVDSGATHTTVAPVHEGYVLSKGVRSCGVGGDAMDTVMQNMVFPHTGTRSIVPLYAVEKKWIASTTTAALAAGGTGGSLHVRPLSLPHIHPTYHLYRQREVLRDIKESICRVSEKTLDCSGVKYPSTPYELPDGTTIELGNERFLIPEHLFVPNAYPGALPSELIGGNSRGDSSSGGGSGLGAGAPYTGLTSLLTSSVSSLSADLHRELYSNVVVGGGNTLFGGFTQRVGYELSEQLPPALKVRVVTGSSTGDRKYAGWLGGSILASLGTFHQMWISSAEYREHGARIVQNKCP